MPKQSTTQTEQPITSDGSNRPLQSVRHRNLKATIWKNETDNGAMYNVTIVRSYKDENNEWHDVTSFGYDDLMNVAKLMYDAHSIISVDRAKNGSNKKENARRS